MAARYCQKTAPKDFCDTLEQYGDMLNAPSIGNTLQHFFASVQVNISPAATASHDCKYFSTPLPYMCSLRSTATTFNSSLGQFAEPHIDKNDAGAALTAMTLLLSVPEGYNAGIFAYHDFKLFISSPDPSIVYFTGLHMHGGTAPSPPPGQESLPWAYRLTIISYPNARMMEGKSRNPIAPFRGFDVVKKNATEGSNREDTLKMPPEVRFRERYLTCNPHVSPIFPFDLTVATGRIANPQT
jgi:hypothetical protein